MVHSFYCSVPGDEAWETLLWMRLPLQLHNIYMLKCLISGMVLCRLVLKTGMQGRGINLLSNDGICQGSRTSAKL